MQHRLIDECRLALVPVLLGRGNPLFKDAPGTTMNLLEARPLKNGCVILRYEPRSEVAGS
jgi:dihydrofolate reductase